MALAQAGADVTGIDTNAGQLAVAARRAEEAGVGLTLREADFNASLPLADASFDAITSRLALMAADDPVATLAELRRVLEPGGRLVTVLWASPAENPWFAIPREPWETSSAPTAPRSRGRSGSSATRTEAAEVHRAAGLNDVVAVRIEGRRVATSAAAHWDELAAEIGHFRKVAAALGPEEKDTLTAELEARLAPYSDGGQLSLPRALVLVTARR